MLIRRGKIRQGTKEGQQMRLGTQDGTPLPAQIVNIYLPNNSRDELPRVIQERISGNGPLKI